MLSVEIGQRDDVGAAEDRRDLGVLDEAGDEADPARRLDRQAPQRLDVHARVADDPQLGALDLGERLEQVLEPLVGAQQTEEEDDRSPRSLQLGRQRLLLRQPGQVVEGPVRDDAHAAGVEADLLTQPGGAVLGVGDDRVHRTEDPARGRDLAAARARRQDVVGGQQPRPVRRQQVHVEPRRGQPLVVDDVGVERPAQAQHVGEVLCRLEGDAGAGVEAAGGAAAVEALPHRVALGQRHRAVEEAGGEQLDLGAAAGQRRREGAVVGWREGRGVE